MKKIEAIVRHNKVDAVKEALLALGHHGMTVTEVRGFGRQRGHTESYRGAEYKVDFVPKMKIEAVVADSAARAAASAILGAARTGEVGDGKIFLTEVGEAIRIRTGESGEAAV